MSMWSHQNVFSQNYYAVDYLTETKTRYVDNWTLKMLRNADLFSPQTFKELDYFLSNEKTSVWEIYI